MSRQSLAALERSQENLVRPEVLRVHGELLAQRGQVPEGLWHIDQALAVAEEQASVFCALRAHVSASRINPGRAGALAEALARFPAEMTTADLADARAALATIRERAG